jgi:hypothetical protein
MADRKGKLYESAPISSLLIYDSRARRSSVTIAERPPS